VGVHNFIFLAGIIGAVLMSGMVDWGQINVLGVHRGVQDWVRDGLLIVMGVLSMATTAVEIREDNDFTWFPIIEVAYLFVGIFITMIPCLLILKAGASGQLAFLINAVKEPVHYFWVTGALSGFLDNAPTYLTFFNTALGSHLPGHGRGPGGSAADDGQIPLPESHLRRCRFFRSLQLYWQCPQLHGPLHIRRGRDAHAQFLRIYFEIYRCFSAADICGGNPYFLLGTGGRR
jgi:hypothetical protein